MNQKDNKFNRGKTTHYANTEALKMFDDPGPSEGNAMHLGMLSQQVLGDSSEVWLICSDIAPMYTPVLKE
jgi:hypothetical protein